MTESNFLKIYKGQDAVRECFDPHSAPPLPLVELPPCLNPYHQDGVRIYAKLMTNYAPGEQRQMHAR